jgi:two-component system LytT family response regulator
MKEKCRDFRKSGFQESERRPYVNPYSGNPDFYRNQYQCFNSLLANKQLQRQDIRATRSGTVLAGVSERLCFIRLVGGATLAVMCRRGTNGLRENTNARNFVTNLFVVCNVNSCMGWSPQIETRLREIRMMIPEIRAVIADNDKLARHQLRLLLAEETGVDIVAECSDALQLLAAVKAHKPDLLLLDIEMRDADGFEVLNSISQEDMPIVILTSTGDQHAIRAFEARALDYLLKPFSRVRLHASIERVRSELMKTHDRHLTYRILDLLAEARSGPRADRRLLVKTAGRVVLVDMDEIDWIEAAGNYVELKTSGGSYVLREGVGHLSERLDPEQFVRIHRSIIVNVRRIKELLPCNRGEYMVVLKDGKQLSCSRSYRARLQQAIAAQ